MIKVQRVRVLFAVENERHVSVSVVDGGDGQDVVQLPEKRERMKEMTHNRVTHW